MYRNSKAARVQLQDADYFYFVFWDIVLTALLNIYIYISWPEDVCGLVSSRKRAEKSTYLHVQLIYSSADLLLRRREGVVKKAHRDPYKVLASRREETASPWKKRCRNNLLKDEKKPTQNLV